jgi:capsular polysaccharide biosynthesis protein/Mrp family chromosome partitioning ATPase
LDLRYLRILLRWIWLFILVTIVAAASAYLIDNQQSATYTAKTRLIIGPGIDSPNPDLNALRTSGQLIQTYAELPTTTPFLREIIGSLGLDMTPDRLRQMISVTSNAQTQILTIRVRAGDPVLATSVANVTADTLVQMSPSSPDSTANQIREQMLSQTARLEQDIAEIESEIQKLQLQTRVRELDSSLQGSVAQQRLILDRISEEHKRLADTNRTLAMLYESLLAPITNQVKILEQADAAERVSSHRLLKMMVGGATGLILSVLIVLAFVYFADVVESADELPHAADTPFLGTIATHRRSKERGPKGLTVLASANSRATEDYRMLGTKLISSHATGNQVHSVLLTSAEDGEDASEIAANLGVVLAQSGFHVILVDADLHQPNVGRLVGAEGRDTLAQLLTDPSLTPQPTPVACAPGLFVVPGGVATSNAFALLASPSMVAVIQKLKQQADIIILIGPPMLTYADSLLLAPHVDAAILTVRSGRTQRTAVAKSISNLRLAGATLIGTVLSGTRYGQIPILNPVATMTKEDHKATLKNAVNGSGHREAYHPKRRNPVAS